MTNEEKRQKIREYCSRVKSCEKCPQKDNRFCANHNYNHCSEKIVNEWFALFFGDDTHIEETPKTRADFLKEVEYIICKDRNEQYGEPEDNFKRIAVYWSNYLDREITSADVAIMMVLFKAARIATGKHKEDNWVDLVGYGVCGAECAVREVK